MKKNLPARRYDVFLTAFEKEVERAQAKIALMNRLQKVYETVRCALESEDLENVIKLELDPNGVIATITPLPADRKSFFDSLVEKIGTGLKLDKLHHDGRPAAGQYSYSFTYKWNLVSFKPVAQVKLSIDVPIEGTQYIKIRRIPCRAEAYTYEDVKLEWLEEPGFHNNFVEEIPF
jgi:hypothetical protein